MYEPIDREEVVRVIRMYGPLQPLDVKRRLGKGETTLIGATLSELAHHGKVAITQLKRGSSPFYYDPNNLASLEKVSEYLGEKDGRTFDKLKNEKVIDSSTVDPLTRVSLSQIKDYSRPMQVRHNGEEILFYRYFLVTSQDAEQMIKEILEPAPKPQPIAKAVPVVEPEPAVARPIVRAQKQEKKPVRVPTPSPVKKKSQKSALDSQKTLFASTKNEVVTDDEFLKRITRFCNRKGIFIIEHEVIRKKQEIDLVVRMQTAVGKAEYYIKAKSKKKSNDGDVAGALLAAQRKQLPAIYLTTGEVTKKAKEMQELKAVIIKEIRP